MNKTPSWLLPLATCSLLVSCVVACKPDAAEPRPPAYESEEAVPLVSDPGETGAGVGDQLSRRVAAAVANLADLTGLPADAIKVRKASSVNWGSSAAGCPRPGMNYMQVIVPGVLVLLEADGRVYRYHGSSEGELFYCPDDRAEAPAYGSGEEFM